MKDLTKIKAALEKHRWAYAERELLKRLKATPNDLCLLELLQKLYWKKDDDQKAFNVAKKAHLLAPKDPMLLWNFAASLSNIYKEKEAIIHYKKLLKERNETLARHAKIRTSERALAFKLDVCVRIGGCYADTGAYERAIMYYKKYLKEKKQNIPTMYNTRSVRKDLKECLFNYLYNIKKYTQKTYKIAQEAYATAPNDPMVLWSFAAWTHEMFKYKKAIELYKKILRKRNDTLVRHADIRTHKVARGFKLAVYVRIGLSFMSNSDYKGAVPYFNKYLKEKNKNIPSEFSRAAVKEFLKECYSLQ